MKPLTHRLLVLFAALWVACASGKCFAQEHTPERTKEWELTLAPYAHHWHYNPEHRPVFLMALDRQLSDDRFYGLALFRNSFGQPSGYLYAGKQWNGWLGNPHLFVRLSAGLIDGYRGKYQDKIPYNQYGIAPAIIPAFGYKFNPNDSAQIMVLGTAGILFAYGHRF